MSFFDQSYYALTKANLSRIGMWPKQLKYERLIRRLTVFALALTFVAPRLTRLNDIWKDMDSLLHDMPFVLVGAGNIVIVLRMIQHFDEVTQSFENMETHWEILKNTSAVVVLDKYAERGRFTAVVYTAIIYTAMVFYWLLCLSPVILDVINPLNETRPKIYIFSTEDHVYKDKYYWFILAHEYIVTFVGVAIVIALQTVYSTWAVHACSLFEVVSFAELIESICSRPLATTLGCISIMIVFTGLQALIYLKHRDMLMQSAVYMILQVFNLYIISAPGQELIDHSQKIHTNAYDAEWPGMSVKVQKLLILIMIRSSQPCRFTARTVYVLSMESFGSCNYEDAMPARRRRGVSDLDNDFVITTSNDNYNSAGVTNHQQYYNERGTTSGRIEQEDTKEREQPTPVVMTSRDRSNEFANAIRTMQGRTAARAAVRSPRQARHIQSYSNFMMIAQNIGKNIASTYTKLEKLALLAKKKSIFNDRQIEIEELTNIIKTDLSSLNKQIAKLQELGRKQREGNSQGHHIASHSSSVVVTLQSKLANMSNHFKSVLEVRSENMREEQSRREQFTQGSVSRMLPPSVTSGKQGSLLLMEQDSSTSVSIDLEPGMGQQMMVQRTMRDDTDSYVQSRAETMQNIESTIVELGGIFQQLAHMVKEQEEMVERIDSNIEDTELNVEAAHTEILKYFQSVTNNRWLMIKVFGVLIFFFVFFVVFLA